MNTLTKRIPNYKEEETLLAGGRPLDMNAGRTSLSMFQNKDVGECSTHPTAGADTISDTHFEDSASKPSTKKEPTLKEDTKDQKSESMNKFLNEITDINKGLVERKKGLTKRYNEISEEIDTLKNLVEAPTEILEYALGQTQLRSSIEDALKVGNFSGENSTKKSVNTIQGFLKSVLDNKAKSYEKVFRTEKTEGFRKEQELADLGDLKKRDQKHLHKLQQEQQERYGHLPGNFQIPINGFPGHSPVPYGVPYREMYGFENHPYGAYNGYGNSYVPCESPVMGELQLPQNEIHNSDSLFPDVKPGDLDLNLGEIPQEQLNSGKNDPKNDELEIDAPVMGEDNGGSLFDQIEVKEEPLNELFSDGDNDKELEKDDSMFGDHNSQPDIVGETLDRQEEKVTKMLNGSQQTELNDDFGLFDNADPSGSSIQVGNHQPMMNGSAMFPQSPNPVTGSLYNRQSPAMVDQFMTGSNYMIPSPSPYDIGGAHAYMGYPYVKNEDMFKSEGNFMLGQSMKQENFSGMSFIKQETCDHKVTKTKGKRNKYKMIPTDMKQKAVNMAHQKSVKFAANFYKVPPKSLKRWIKVGCERKKGGGRKTKDPKMEQDLYQWYLERKQMGVAITAKMIKDKAIDLKNCDDFIASKGWLDKFKIRFSLEISKETNREPYKKGVGAVMRKKAKSPMSSSTSIPVKSEDQAVRRRFLNKASYQDGSEADGDNINQEQNSIHVRPEDKTWNQNTTIKEEKFGGEEPYGNSSGIGSLFSNPTSNQFDNQDAADLGNNKGSNQWGTGYQEQSPSLVKSED